MTIHALILAAGQGTRLYPLTRDKPKCLVELAGKPLLQYQQETLRACGIQNISIVAGYCAEQIEPDGFSHVFINADYATSNMVSSLFCAGILFDNTCDIIISYGDIVYEQNVLQQLLAAKAPIALVIDKAWHDYWQIRMENPLDDAETLKVNQQGYISELGKKTNNYADIQAQYIGLIKIDKAYTQAFKKAHMQMDKNIHYDGQEYHNMYLTSFLQYLINLGWQIQAVPIQNGWLEIDSVSDLNCYENLHNQNKLQRFFQLDNQ